ncbi:MAG: GNAT family N-acetyltransferase [Marinicellaceae bacterium]
MIKITLAHSKEDFKLIEKLANIVWTEHYTPIIGKQQVDYMLDKFQSVHSMQNQVKNGAIYYLISYKNQPVGYFSFTVNTDYLFLSKLYVLSDVRGHGIGRDAYNYLEQKSKELGLSKIQLTVNKYNTNSIKIYEKMGFIKTDAIVQDIGKGYVMDDYVMIKSGF